MAAKDQNFELWAGDDARPEIVIKDQEGNEVNLTDAGVEWVAVDQSDGTEMLRKDTDGGGIAITDPENGRCIIKIDGSDTDAMEDATLNHEARVTLQDGSKVHVTVGTITLHSSNI